MTKQSVYTDCGEISYSKVGSGKPVVLLHGFAVDGNIWKYQVDFLKDRFMLIIPDIPGSGNSVLAKQDDVSIDDLADSLHQLLLQANIQTCTIIGHSMGGYIALALAEKYPQFLNGIGLFHSTAYADDEERKQTRRRGIDFIKKNGAHAFLQQAIPNLFTAQFRETQREKVSSLIEAAKQFSNESLIVYYQAMMQRPDRKDVLKTFLKPILFIMGEEDKTLNLQDTLTQSHQPWQSHVYILKNASHMGMWEEEEKSNLILLSYLRQVNEN
jgi:pimeloyl-ACP methyl ester carboxylesterase